MSFAIPTSVPAHWSKSATSATSEVSKADAPSVVAKAFRMLTTAKSARKWRKIEMAVRKSSTLVQQKPICGMNARSTGSGNGSDDLEPTLNAQKSEQGLRSITEFSN